MVLQFVALVQFALHSEGRAHLRRNLDIVIAIDAQNLFHHIARFLHVHAESGSFHLHLLLIRRKDFKAEVLQNALLSLHGQFLTDEVSHILILHINDGILWQRVVLHIDNLHADFATCQFLRQHRCTFEGIYLTCWVNATLKAETGICLQAMTTRTLANPSWVEISTLEEHVLRGLVGSASLSTKHTCDTHWLLHIADSQVLIGKFVLLTIEGNEWSTFWQGLHHHLIALHHISVKAMQGLTIRHHDVVGDIDDVVDRTLTNRCQSVLQPLWTFLHFAVLHRHSAVTRTSLTRFHLHVKLQIVVLHLEAIH